MSTFILKAMIESDDKQPGIDSVTTTRIRHGNVGVQSFCSDSCIADSSNLIKLIHQVTTTRFYCSMSPPHYNSRLKCNGVGSPARQTESPPDRGPVPRPLLFTGASCPVDHRSFITDDIVPPLILKQRRQTTNSSSVALICFCSGQTHSFKGPIEILTQSSWPTMCTNSEPNSCIFSKPKIRRLSWLPIIAGQHQNLKVKKVLHFRIYLVLLCSLIFGSPSRPFNGVPLVSPPSPLSHFMSTEFQTVKMSISVYWKVAIYVKSIEFSTIGVHSSPISNQGTIMERSSYTATLGPRGLLPLLSPYAHNILILSSSEGRLPSKTLAYCSYTLSVGYFNVDHSDYNLLFQTTVVGFKVKFLYEFIHSFNTSIFYFVVVLCFYLFSVEITFGSVCNHLSP